MLTPVAASCRWRQQVVRRHSDQGLGGTRVRVGVFGENGIGSLGNDASLSAMLAFLRREHPSVVPVAICNRPGVVSRAHGVEAAPMTWPPESWAVRPFRRVVGVLRKVAVLPTMMWTVARTKVVVVPGTGLFESYGVRRWDVPYTLACLALATTVLRRDLVVLSVGAEPPDDPVKARLLGWTLRTAELRSFRDDYSRRSARELGVDTGADTVCPDLVFAERPPRRSAPGDRALSVVLGVIARHGPARDAYITKTADLAARLIDRGCQVSLCLGDASDVPMIANVRAAVADLRPETDVPEIRVATLAQLTEHLATADVVVAARYHNLICAGLAGAVPISIGYAPKNDALMADLGLQRFCHPVDSFDAEDVDRQVAEILSSGAELRPRLAAAVERLRDSVDAQYAHVSAMLHEVDDRSLRVARR